MTVPLEGLAASIYHVLCGRVPGEDPRLSYEALVEELGPMDPPNQNLRAFDPRLFAALGELGAACHRRGLPALSAIVVQKAEPGLGMPGPGYYSAAHPEARTDDQKVEAWLVEYRNARSTSYPNDL